MPTKSISDAVNLIETVIQSSDRHRSIPKPMLRPRHRLDSRVKVASRLSSTSSDKPRSSTAFILDGRFSERSLRRHSRPPDPHRQESRTLLKPFDEIFARFFRFRTCRYGFTRLLVKKNVRSFHVVSWQPGRGRRRRRSARRRVASQFLAHRYAVSRRLGVPCEVHGCARTRAVCPSHNPDGVEVPLQRACETG